MKNQTCKSAPSFFSEPAAHRKPSGMLVCAIVFVVVCFCIFGALLKKFFFKNFSFNCFLLWLPGGFSGVVHALLQLQCVGASLWLWYRGLLLASTGSRARELSSCGALAQLP